MCALQYKHTITTISVIVFTIMEFHNFNLKKNLHMLVTLEKEISKSFELQPQMLLSYIDDLFFIWQHGKYYL